MNDLEYLHQISAANRPVQKPGGILSIFQSKIFRVAMIGLVLLIFVLILGAMISQYSGKSGDSLARLNLRMTNISSNITKYNSKVKSSRLRAMGVTLSGIISETTRDVSTVLASSEDTADEKIVAEEAAHGTELGETLERAKINGVLDRTYLHQLIYEVALLISIEGEAMARSSDVGVKTILQKSTDSLNLLYEELSQYSDATN